MIGGEGHREISIFVRGCREFNQYVTLAAIGHRFLATTEDAEIATERRTGTLISRM